MNNITFSDENVIIDGKTYGPMPRPETDEQLAIEMEKYQDIKRKMNAFDKHTSPEYLEKLGIRIEEWLDKACTNEFTRIPSEVISEMYEYQKDCTTLLNTLIRDLERDKKRIRLLDLLEEHLIPRDLSDEKMIDELNYFIFRLMDRRTPWDDTPAEYILTLKKQPTKAEMLERIRARISAMEEKNND